MYNIHSHYENIFSYVKSLLPQPRLTYLHPFGSTHPNDLESINSGGYGPLFFCFDQEPIIPSYNRDLFAHVRNYKDDYGQPRPTIVLNTEKNSQTKNNFLKEFNYADCYYFFHAFAAADWYRGYQYCTDLIPIEQRQIKKKYITFNRITGGARVHRSILVAELKNHNILHLGHVSYSDICPEYGHYKEFFAQNNNIYQFDPVYINQICRILDTIDFPLRIDNKSLNHIPNNSYTISAISQNMESFVHVVTETCFFESKLHLTEKIFKPIVCKQPFLLLGCANNLQYLRSYGFKTFAHWWDETYDLIEDPLTRLKAVVKIVNDICNYSDKDLKEILIEMKNVLDHNYNWFYSKEFLDSVWSELTVNLQKSIFQLELQTP